MTRQIARAESWQRVYEAFQDINFAGFDYYTIKSGMLDYLKLHFPESFNDYIESSELISIIEMFAYVCEVLAYRFDMNAHENILSLAERKKGVLRLAKLLSYTASRNIPLRGLVKITSISTTETLYDSRGINLANKKISWNDTNNINWKEQFILVMNKILQQQFGTVYPSDRVQVDDILFELYKLNNNPLSSGVLTYNVTANSKSVPMELVPVSLTESGPIERRPERSSNFSVLYASDGIGDSSDFTGFFMYTKQGSLQRITTTFDGITPNQVYNIDVSNINDIDVWVNNVNSESGAVLKERVVDLLGRDLGYFGEWEQVDTSNSKNILFNNNPKRNKFEIETLEDDKVKLIFGDGEFADIPQGTFDIWFRTSLNEEIVVPKSEIVNKTATLKYQSELNVPQTLTITFSAVNALANNAPSESVESIKRLASTVYYTQDRMVNGVDYNSYILQDPSVLKVKTVNRTFVGDSKYIKWHDPSGSYENVKVFGDDLRVFYIDDTVQVSIPAFTPREEVVNNYIQSKLGESGVQLFHITNNIPTNRTTFTASELTQINNTVQQAIDTNAGFPVLVAFIKTDTKGYSGIRFNPIPEFANEDSLDNGLVTYLESNDIACSITIDGIEYNFDITTTDFNSTDLPTLLRIRDVLQEKITTAILSTDNVEIIDKTIFIKSTTTGSTSSIVLNLPFLQLLTNDPEVTTSVNGVNSGTWIAYSTDVELLTPYTFSIAYTSPNWDVTSSEISMQCESPTTKFWNTNKTTTVSEFTYDVERDKIVLLKANYDKTGEALLSSYIELDVVGMVNETDTENIGLPNINRLQVISQDLNNDLIPDDPYLYNELLNKTIYTHTVASTPAVVYGPVMIGDEVFEWKAGYDNVEVYLNDTKLNATQFIECDENGDPVNNGDLVSYVKIPDAVFEDNIELKKIDYLFFKRDNVNSPYVYYCADNEISSDEEDTWFTTHEDDEALIQRYRGRNGLNFAWYYIAPNYTLVDPAPTNIHDMFILTRGYYQQYKQWLSGAISEPTKPSTYELRTSYSTLLKSKMFSDTVIPYSGNVKLIIGSKAIPELQSKIRIVKSPTSRLTDNEIKTQVVSHVKDFFDVNYWEFGETFSFTELSALIHSRMSSDIKTIVIVPLYSTTVFGDLYEINARENEIIQPDISVTDIEIVESLNARTLKQYPY